MAFSPGRLTGTCGVSCEIPTQQLHNRTLVELGAVATLLASQELEFQSAVLRVIRIVVESRDFQPVHGQLAVCQPLVGILALSLEFRDKRGIHARSCLHTGINGTEINSLSEGKVVGMEVAACAAGQIAVN